jgi:hypothetical protein
VRRPPVPLVVIPAPRVTEESSPELCRRAAPPHRAVRPSHLRRPRRPCQRSRIAPVLSTREIEPPSLIPRFTTTARHRSPPSSAARRRSGACVHPRPLDPDLATLINPPPLLKSASSAAVGSRSNGSDRANPGQYRSNRQAFAFFRKPLSFPDFTKKRSRSSRLFTVRSFCCV